jgi:hypothetical protein
VGYFNAPHKALFTSFLDQVGGMVHICSYSWLFGTAAIISTLYIMAMTRKTRTCSVYPSRSQKLHQHGGQPLDRHLLGKRARFSELAARAHSECVLLEISTSLSKRRIAVVW